MTTPRIEEKRGRKIGEDKYAEHWSLDGHSYIQVPKWVITQAHQAGYTDGYKQGKFDAEVTAEYGKPEALQDNK